MDRLQATLCAAWVPNTSWAPRFLRPWPLHARGFSSFRPLRAALPCLHHPTPPAPQILVFSDEFNKEGRSFKAGDKDPRWTAQDMYYFPTHDEEVYKPEQVTTAGTWGQFVGSSLGQPL